MPEHRKLSVVILGSTPHGGGDNPAPVSLVRVGIRTVMRRQVDVLRSLYRGCDITLVAGPDASFVKATAPKDVLVVQDRSFEDGCVLPALKLGLAFAEQPDVLILPGDFLPVRETMFRVIGPESSLLVDSKGMLPKSNPGVVVRKDRVSHLDYGVATRQWSGVAYTTGPVTDALFDFAFEAEHRALCLHEAINAVIDSGGVFRAVEPKRYLVRKIDGQQGGST